MTIELVRQSEAEEEVPAPPSSHKWKLRSCCIVIYLLWLMSVVLTFMDIYAYYEAIQKWRCGQCYLRSYLLVAMGISILLVPLLFLAIPLVVLRRARGIRIYATIIFLATYLEMMLGIVFMQDYHAVSDVSQSWKQSKSLDFFEVKFKCCGVLGPNDYTMEAMEPPKSCYKDRSGRTEDLYTTGCSTLIVAPTKVTVSLVVSLLGQYAMVLALVIYMVILKRTKTPMRPWQWLHPPVRIEVESR